jgi:hypothetical protein
VKKSEVARVLTRAASFDQRTLGDADVDAWFQVIGDLDFAECMAKVIEHYRSSTDRLMPAHLRAGDGDGVGVPPWERQ